MNIYLIKFLYTLNITMNINLIKFQYKFFKFKKENGHLCDWKTLDKLNGK